MEKATTCGQAASDVNPDDLDGAPYLSESLGQRLCANSDLHDWSCVRPLSSRIIGSGYPHDLIFQLGP